MKRDCENQQTHFVSHSDPFVKESKPNLVKPRALYGLAIMHNHISSIAKSFMRVVLPYCLLVGGPKAWGAPYHNIKCESLSQSTLSQQSRPSIAVTLLLIPESSWPRPRRSLTPPQRRQILGDGIPSVGNAVRYLSLLNGRTSRELVTLWMELVEEIRIFFPEFESKIFEIDGGRFLLEGKRGEKLFIDFDGTIYRVVPNSINQIPDHFQDQDRWEIEYSQIYRQTPM